MLHIVILAGAVLCAILAIRAARLLVSALWLAGTSALVALSIYLLGAPELAVIELSVGAGLVTVLFVFAINIAGEEVLDSHPIIPRPLAWILALLPGLLLAALTAARLDTPLKDALPGGFGQVFWEQRGLDVLVQIALIFAGVLGVLGLLSDPQAEKGMQHPAAIAQAEPPQIEQAPEEPELEAVR